MSRVMPSDNEIIDNRRDYESMTDAELIIIIGDVEPDTSRADLIILAEEIDLRR